MALAVFDPDQFRVQLLLQLPKIGIGGTGRRLVDGDYDELALAAWILEQFELARLYAGTEVLSLAGTKADESTRTIEAATAAGVISSSMEFVRYIGQVQEVVKQGLSLASSWDFARTIGEERSRLINLVAALVTEFPQLAPYVGAPDADVLAPRE